MKMSLVPAPLVLTVALVASMSACARTPGNAAPASEPATTAAAGTPAAATMVATGADADADPAASAANANANANADALLPTVVVHKSASCGCCTLWVDHMREAGFAVEVRNEDNLNTIKERVGVPLGRGSCHTAEVGGYFVEGHVPADDVKKLLAEMPDAKGLTVPGMPAGSPGMELPDGTTQPYTVELVAKDGSVSAFSQHGP